MKVKTLTPKQIDAFCSATTGWKAARSGKYLQKTFSTPGYIDGLMLVTRIAIHAEIANHHPDVTLSYNTVTVKLSTHDAGGITTLDTGLAQAIDEVANR